MQQMVSLFAAHSTLAVFSKIKEIFLGKEEI